MQLPFTLSAAHMRLHAQCGCGWSSKGDGLRAVHKVLEDSSNHVRSTGHTLKFEGGCDNKDIPTHTTTTTKGVAYVR